ncbi:MAG: Fic family protein [Planctomycetota bacterium]|nr:MAG: Fic family protein [Planctomycetota bacterium]REJ93958.1 MAG: Fic family protein [Planctomycetota bacterium]REK30938.1 MAG: Fic family protein [Planctomycetota bacterium]REK38190.1 MAG: Fic family protein [Planctomycetota bacterium]
MRAGKYVNQATGYRAFLPAELPPDPPVKVDGDLPRLLSDADRALGRLDGVASVLPNPDLFVAMYVRHEAVLSSQIEGTQSTLEDVLEFELEGKASERAKDVEEVVNYVGAMNHGLRRLEELPLCLRLLREIHGELLQGVRGSERSPGEFRTSQNWIGPTGCTLKNAAFVPPPPAEMREALNDLERFLHDRTSLPVLIHCALAHAQFETIHPFLDGNGRVGRLLITLLLCEREILHQPLLYLSYYLKAHRAQYYDRLMAIRNDGDWEGWVRFFLRGVFEVSQGATETARAILDLREKHRKTISERGSGSANGHRLLDFLFERPIISVRMAEEHLACSYVTAANVVDEMARLGILREITGQQRNRKYRYDPFMELFDRQILPLPDDEATRDIPTTES